VEKRSVSVSGSPQMKRLRQPVKCELFVGWGRQTDCSLQVSVMQVWVSTHAALWSSHVKMQDLVEGHLMTKLQQCHWSETFQPHDTGI
jgi:hypothetical protein